MSEWPLDWRISSLEELASHITSGGTPTSGSPRYYSEAGGLPFAKTEDLTRAKSKYLDDCELHVTEAALRDSAAKKYPTGTILVSMYGTIGLTKITARELAANQALCALIPPFTCDSNYLYHHLDFIRQDWLRFSGQTTQANISGAVVRAREVPLPPAREQKEIAKVLTTLDTAIRETELLIDKLQAVKQGLLHDLLTRGIDANGQLRPPQSEAPQLYKESPLGWIPREWSLTQLGKVAALQRGYDIVEAKLTPGPFPVISSSGIVGYHNASTSSGPNVLVGRKGSIGTVHFVETDLWAHDTSLFVTNFFGNCEKFVFYLFNYLRLGQYGTKSGSPSLNRNDVHPLPICRPSLDEQNEIVRILDSQHDEVSRSEHERNKLMKLKAGLMDDLLTGRVRVTPLLQGPSC